MRDFLFVMSPSLSLKNQRRLLGLAIEQVTFFWLIAIENYGVGLPVKLTPPLTMLAVLGRHK